MALAAAFAVLGTSRVALAYIEGCEPWGGGGGYGGTGGECQVVDEGSSGSGGGAYCDEICNFDALCGTPCLLRTQACTGGFNVPSSGDLAGDTGTTSNGNATNGQLIREHQEGVAAGDGAEQNGTDDSLVCDNGSDQEQWSTCSAFGRCLASSGNSDIATMADVNNAPCPPANSNTLAKKSTKPSNGNKWFKFDYKISPGAKYNWRDATIKSDVSFGVTVFNTYMPIAWLDVKSDNSWGAAAQAALKGDVKLYLLGIQLFSGQGTRKTMPTALVKNAHEWLKENAATAPKVKDKKAITWNTPRIGTFVGPVYVSVYAWAKAGWDIDVKPEMVDRDGKLIGIEVAGGPKGYLHGGATAQASVILASIGISGTLNILTVAARVKLFLQAQNPTTYNFDLHYLRAYLGADIDVTTLDGSISLWIRVLWKKWTIKLAEWTGLRKVWAIGNAYHAHCSDVSNGTNGPVALSESDFTETGTPP